MHFINIFNLHMKPAFSELGREFLVAAVCGWVVIFFSTCIPESYSKKKKKKNANKYVYQLRQESSNCSEKS